MKLTIPDTISRDRLVKGLDVAGLRFTSTRLPDGSWEVVEVPPAARAWREAVCDYEGCRKVNPSVSIDHRQYCAEHAMRVMCPGGEK